MPKSFKLLTSRAQKMFRKLLDPEPGKRLELGETVKFMEDKWVRKAGKLEGKDGQSQLTLGSFQVRLQGENCYKTMTSTVCRAFIQTCVKRIVFFILYFNTVSLKKLM